MPDAGTERRNPRDVNELIDVFDFLDACAREKIVVVDGGPSNPGGPLG